MSHSLLKGPVTDPQKQLAQCAESMLLGSVDGGDTVEHTSCLIDALLLFID